MGSFSETLIDPSLLAVTEAVSMGFIDKFTVDNRAIVRALVGRELWSIKE